MSDESFLGRWSRRKRAAGRKGGAPAGTAAVDDSEGDAAAEPTLRPRPGVMNTEPREPTVGALAKPAAPTAAAAVAAAPAAELPPIEELGASSDYRGFLRDGVPEELKNAALRKLWRSNPMFALRDGLDDYDEDFAALAAVGEKLAKMRQAGRRLVDRRQAATAKQGVAAGSDSNPPPAPEDASPEALADATESAPEEGVAAAETRGEDGTPAGRSGHS